MPQVFIGIGSNIEKEKNLRSGVAQLHAYYAPMVLSEVYESPAVGFEGEPFLNLVAAFDTDEALETIQAKLMEIERAHGRVRGQARFSARTLDLDLLLYGDLVKRDNGLRIPRTDIAEYAFVLKPLAEIAPHWRHPETGVTFTQMWREFNAAKQPLRRIGRLAKTESLYMGYL